MKTFVAAVAVAAATACVSDVHAHTYLTQPLAEFKSGASKSSWVAEFSPPWSGKFKTGAQYAAVAPGKGYKNLRSFLEDKGPVCGNTLQNAKAKPVPSDGLIKLASTIEHPGPCEVWLDNTLAFHNDDCEKKFGSATSFKVDFSSCKGSCMLRFYWLGLQDSGTRWQSYKNCIPLSGGKSRSFEDEEENERESEPLVDIADIDAASFAEQEAERESLESFSEQQAEEEALAEADAERSAAYNETAHEDADEYTFANLNEA